MISCTEFILAYSELFKFLEDRGGEEEVVRFWEYISDNFLTNLREYAEKEGLAGCFKYWSHTLNEEAADFTMVLDEDEGVFTIQMHHCPSMGKLLETRHIEPYRNYCRHCQVLYSRILEPLGYSYELDLSRASTEATCSLRMTKRRKP